MKKLSLLLVAVACLCSGKANAQEGKGSINFVPYVGVNYSDFSGDPNKFFGGTSGKVNFMAGMRFDFQIMSKSALLVDLNYRRLGATSDVITRWYTNESPYTTGVSTGDYHKEEMYRTVKEYRGIVYESTKVTLDLVSLALQFKQNIIGGLSARVGLEGTVNLAEKWHYHYYDYYNYEETGSYEEGDVSNDADNVFHDKDIFNVAIPFGLTYDYKNFSVNATYHLPFSECAKDGEYYLCNQAFDLTIGYRLPLRKR